jgi:tRNA pseudouridine38-40 synthase
MYKAVIAYDGTKYFGWQKTKTGPSIQEELERAARKITCETVLFEAASRTDRGVHARGQVVQFGLQKEKSENKLLLGLNAVLPSDIRVVELGPKVFHPTLDASGKEYRYQICTESAQNPTMRLYSWHFPYCLDEGAIQRAIPHLLGIHDFSALANEEKSDPVCTLRAIEFDGKEFRIQGNRFLYKMVRNLVGLLVYVGVGKIGVDRVPQILKSKDRKLAGVTAPAHGLYLHQVFYNIK